MVPKNDTGGPLVEAAAALEHELQRFENAVETARQSRLMSGRALQRSATALQDAAQSEARIGAARQGLLAAITLARERQVAAAARLVERGEEIKARAGILQDLLERRDALGVVGAEINATLQNPTTDGDAPSNGGAEPEALSESAPEDPISTALARMGQAADDAKALAQSAKQADFPDIAQEADSLRQQILAARNKLSLLQRH